MGPRHRGAAGTARTAGYLLILGLLAACERPAQSAADIPHTPIPKVEARFSMQARDDRVTYRGVVADQGTRDAVVSALRAATGASGRLDVDPRTLPAPWATALGPAATALRGTGARLDFAGRRIELHGELDPEQRATLHGRLERIYPGYTLGGALAGVDPRLALPAPGDRDALLAFLNAVPLSFHADSGMLSSAGVDAVTRAVRGLQSAGAAAHVEALIHPDADPQGEPGIALSQQRRQALTTQFALRGIVAPQMTVRDGPFVSGREGQVEFAAPAPPAATPPP